jgi:integrase
VGDIITRTLKNGRVAYYARYLELDGKRTSRATKARNEDEARKFLYALEARVAAGKVGLAKPTKEQREAQAKARERAAITVRELGEKFCAEYVAPKVKDIEKYRREAKSNLRARVFPYLADLQAQAVTPADVERMRDGLMAKLAPASVLQAKAALSKLYTWGRAKGLLTCPSPTTPVEWPSAEGKLDFLSATEVASLLAYVRKDAPYLEAMIATAIYTGMRKGELFGLRWRDVHLDAGRIDVARSYTTKPKSGKARHLPINPELAAVLHPWKATAEQRHPDLVFPLEGRMGTTYETLDLPEILDAAKCSGPDRGWHTLRHTFASHFMMAGGNILTLQKLLGHADLKTTMIYAHLSPDFMAAEVARMSFPAAEPAEVYDIAAARRRRDGYPEGNGAKTSGHHPQNANGDPEVPVADYLVSPEGIEPSTNGLRVRCSTN